MTPPRAADRRLRTTAVLVLLAALCSATPGCAGYRFGARSLYPAGIATVHVPVFDSDSLRRNLGERLTEAVVKEIELKTPYKVVDAASADSILSGRIVVEGKRVITENINDEPRDIETEFQVQVSWIDRRGLALGHPGDLAVSPLLVNLGHAATFVPEAGQSLTTAQQEAIVELARQIVARMEAPW
jgi:hypothetical protein